MKDQSKFLGLDLNASAITALKPNATKLNTSANSIFTKVDGVTKMYDDSIASLKA